MNKEGIKLLQDKYRLTEDEAQQYNQNVNLLFTTGKKKEEGKHKLVFVAGQAGAGKSKLVPEINKQLGYNAVISDYDTIRAMHPNFSLANKEVPSDVHLALLPDADNANETLRNYCRDNGLNLIYEGTMRGTAGFLRMAREFKEAGYDIELALMAVPKLESLGSTIFRYATDLLANNSPRWVPKSVHDESYEKFIVTLEELSKNKLFDRASVYRRGYDEKGTPVKIYTTEEKQFKDPIEAVKYGRERYRRDALLGYGMKHSIVCDIFATYAPHLLVELKPWEELYDQEKENLEKDAVTQDGREE